ncbi:hypothetical protein ACFYN3_28120, partial [Streptomyces lavendulae]|uniref:hypothetical protein n=1 Tax=Streptomyces lavendulae TaxID=1914 RepID=UPI0033D4E62D
WLPVQPVVFLTRSCQTNDTPSGKLRVNDLHALAALTSLAAGLTTQLRRKALLAIGEAVGP